MAKLYGDLPCAKVGEDIHITISAKACLCGQSWSYEPPYLDKPGIKRTNIIWRAIEAVTCPKCRSLYAETVIAAPDEPEYYGYSGEITIDESGSMGEPLDEREEAVVSAFMRQYAAALDAGTDVLLKECAGEAFPQELDKRCRALIQQAEPLREKQAAEKDLKEVWSVVDQTKMVPMPGLALVREDYKTNLQYHRNLKRISQAELAVRADVNWRTLQDYEQGNRDINKAQVATVVRLADVLGVPVQDLLEPRE